jgi:hypothetical protein
VTVARRISALLLAAVSGGLLLGCAHHPSSTMSDACAHLRAANQAFGSARPGEGVSSSATALANAVSIADHFHDGTLANDLTTALEGANKNDSNLWFQGMNPATDICVKQMGKGYFRGTVRGL